MALVHILEFVSSKLQAQEQDTPMVSQKPESDKVFSRTIPVSESNAESESISSDSCDEVFWEEMPRSKAKALIQTTTLPFEDALTILYSLVDHVAEKSLFSTTSTKMKLINTHKAL